MQVLGDELDMTLLEVQRLQSLPDSPARNKDDVMETEGEQQFSEKENSDGEEESEEVEGGNLDHGDDVDDGNGSCEHDNEGEQGECNKMIVAVQPDTYILTDTLVAPELEEHMQPTLIPVVAEQSTSFGADMAGYEQTSLQTDMLVANILADIIASTSKTDYEEPSEAPSGSFPEAAETIPSPIHQSQTPENIDIKNLTEDRDKAKSLVIQLTREKTELQAQITSLLKERDDALLLVEQLTNEKASLETESVDKN